MTDNEARERFRNTVREQEAVTLVLDSFTVQNSERSHPEFANANVRLLVVPPHATNLVLLLDVTFFRQYKILFYRILRELKLQFDDEYRETLTRYGIIKPSGSMVNKIAFGYDKTRKCDVRGCNNQAHIRCAHCRKHLCAKHFYHRVCFHGDNETHPKPSLSLGETYGFVEGENLEFEESVPFLMEDENLYYFDGEIES